MTFGGTAAESARRGRMPVRLMRRRGLAGGKRTLQIPPAQWAARHYRIYDVAEGLAFRIGTSSHGLTSNRPRKSREPLGRNIASQSFTLA